MNAQHTPMVVAAARALCKRAADECNVDFDDAWKVYGQEHLADAQSALDAAGAPDLLAALQGLDEAYCRAGAPTTQQERHEDRLRLMAARAAIAKATGTTS